MYFPWENWLAPVSYGILVIDYKTKTIVSCNTYFRPGSFMTDDEMVKFLKLTNPEAYKEFLIIKKRHLLKKQDGEELTSDIDMKKIGWTLLNYKTNLKGIKDAQKKIEQIGFKLSKEEKKMWKDFIKEQER
jgi:hypothetical protein